MPPSLLMLLDYEQLISKNRGTTRDRETAYKAVINTWLKDRTPYCVECGERYFKGRVCCDNMKVMTNWTYTQQIISQNKVRRESNYNDYGSMKDHPKDIRCGLSMPISLYNYMNNFEKMHGRKFLDGKKDLHWFARRFPQFCIMKRI